MTAPSAPQRPPRLILRFAIYTAIVFLLAALGILWYVRHEASERAERELAFHADFVANSILSHYLEPSDFREPVTGPRRNALDAFFAERVLVGDVLRVKLWRADGTVTYSNDHSLIGDREEADEISAALSGEPAHEVSTLNREGGAGADRKVLEAYVPVRLSGSQEIAGVLELYEDYAPVSAARSSEVTAVGVALGLALLLLYAALFPILRQLTGALQSRSQRLAQQAEALQRTLDERERAEKRLSEAERNYRNLVEQLPLVTYIDRLNETSSSIYMSPQIEDMLGYPVTAWLSDPDFFPKVLHPEDRDRVLAQHRDAYSTGRSFSAEYRLVARDGRVVWVQDEVVIAHDPSGRPLHAQGFLVDVSERKRADEKLERQHAEVEALHETALGLINRLDVDDLLEAIATRAGGLVGTSNSYVYLVDPDNDRITVRIGTGVFVQHVGYSVGRGEGLAGRVWKTGKPLAVEDYHAWSGRRLDLDGLPFRAVVGVPLRAGPDVVGVLGLAYLEEGRTFGHAEIELLSRFGHLASVALENARLYTGLQEELEERRRAEEALRESDETVRTLVANVPGAIFRCAFDADWTMEFLSDAIEEIVGYPAAEFIHNRVRSYASVIHAEDRAMVEEAVGDGSPYSVEYRVVRPDGEVRWVLERGQGVPDATGKDWLQGAIFDITEQRSVEEKGLQLAAIVESSEDAIMSASLDGLFTSWNPGAERIFGYTAEEAVGRPISILTPPEREGEAFELLEGVARGGVLAQHETVRVRKDGTRIDVAFTFSPLRNTAGEIVGVSAIVHDISARKRAEEALREKTAFVELLHAVAAAANESSTPEEAMQTCLDRVCAHTQWPVGHVYTAAEDSTGELVSTKLWHLADEEQFEVFRRITDATRFPPGVGLPGRVLASGEPLWIMDVTADSNFPRARQAEEIGVRAGFAFPVLVGKEVAAVLEFFSPEAVEPDESLLNVMAHVGAQLGRAIERKRAEEALRNSEEHHRSVIETANDPFISIDASGVITDWNERAERTFGWSREEVLGRSLAETIIPPSYREAHRKGMKRFLATGEGPVLSSTVEVEALHRDGHEFSVELTVWPVQVGQDYQFNAFLRDVSERKRAESERESLLAAAEEARGELAAQNERLLELDRLKDEFIALVSHELRTPLTSIRGYVELLSDGEAGELNPEQQQFLSVVERNSDRLLRLVGDLLFLAQIEAGKLVLDTGALDLAAVASESVEAARPAAEEKGVTVTLATGPVPLLAGDRARIAQLLDNLISNAVKFTPAEGRVDVRVRSLDRQAVLEVRDSGIGIPAEEQKHLFGRFFRGSNATAHAVQGTGLGLAISKAIVEAHGGAITVVSEENAGTTFSVTFPIGKPAEEPEQVQVAL